jgi:hypothetical protein
MADIEYPLVAPGTVVRDFSKTEAQQFVSDWLAVFGRNRKGVNTKSYLWHVFSGGRYPCIDGGAAIDAYRQQTGAEFIVLSNHRDVAFLTELRPESSSLVDYYVFPPNLAWTMAFTHEDGWHGPYFARHPDYSALNVANQARLHKAAEAANARKRGWC